MSPMHVFRQARNQCEFSMQLNTGDKVFAIGCPSGANFPLTYGRVTQTEIASASPQQQFTFEAFTIAVSSSSV